MITRSAIKTTVKANVNGQTKEFTGYGKDSKEATANVIMELVSSKAQILESVTENVVLGIDESLFFKNAVEVKKNKKGE
jgi:hypothetical protein